MAYNKKSIHSLLSTSLCTKIHTYTHIYTLDITKRQRNVVEKRWKISISNFFFFVVVDDYLRIHNERSIIEQFHCIYDQFSIYLFFSLSLNFCLIYKTKNILNGWIRVFNVWSYNERRKKSRRILLHKFICKIINIVCFIVIDLVI